MESRPVVLVTGGAGLIGTAVIRALRRLDELFVATVRPGGNLRGSREILEIDFESSSSAATLASLPEIGAVIHCAAATPAVDSGLEAERCGSANLRIDSTVADFARERHARLVFCSGASVYRPSNDGQPVREGDELRPDGAYTEAKVESEALIATRVSSFALLRITSPYGYPMTKRTVLRTFIERALAQDDLTYFGTGDRSQDFLHADDVAAAALSALAHPEFNGAVNICSGRETSMRELAELVARIASSGSVARSVDEPDPQAGRRAVFDRTLASEALGWEPAITLEDGIAAVMSAAREDWR